MAEVKLRNIRKAYGSLVVIDDVNVDVEDGQFVALVGPSGCGKSTLLRILAGLDKATSGDVIIDGNSVNHLIPKERDIAMVFQSYALYPHMTVEQNMSLALKLRRRPKEEIGKRVHEAAEILGLGPLLGRYPRELSGGQRQRVAMGRAIVRDPKVFLFDEPLSNLDAKLRVQMRVELKELHQRLQTTTVYVTHDQIEAMTLADKIIVLRNGRIEQQGAALDLFDRPANIFVAGFLGSPSMNFLPARREGGVLLVDGAGGLPVPGDIGALPADLIIGVRPEDLELGPEGLSATVLVVEPTGTDTHVVLDLAGRHVTISTRERPSLRSGQQVNLSVNPSRLHLFDPRTEQSLR